MQRIRKESGLSLRKVENAPEAAGKLPRSTLGAVLFGQRPASLALLGAFLAVCHASEPVTVKLLFARERVEDPAEAPPELFCARLREERAHQARREELARADEEDSLEWQALLPPEMRDTAAARHERRIKAFGTLPPTDGADSA
ncbi:hypothetical protein [Streptomyces sp. NPDC055287]